MTTQILLGLFQPLIDLFHCSIVVAAGSTSAVAWGHMTYRARGPRLIDVAERRSF